MKTLIVVNNPNNWTLQIPGVELVSARAFLTDKTYVELKRAKIFNLCRSYRYQSIGYYVSLLAEARGHKAIPSITTIQDLKSQTLIRFVSEELDKLIQKSLSPIQSDRFVLSIYFGRNVARRYDRLSSHLFKLFHSPLLRAYFVRTDRWQLQNIDPISASEIPESHREFVVEFAQEYLSGRRSSVRTFTQTRYDLAILWDENGEEPASDAKAIRKFVRAAESLDFGVEVIGRDDYGRVAEFDALFIRDTTSVNHYTYRFARRGSAEGLVVIDDPESILRCLNKVYLAELLNRHQIPTPRTLVVSKENLESVVEQLGLPCVLKQPDSAFSQGVSKVDSQEALIEAGLKMLDKSELIIGQEFLPTDFDWRIGTIDRKPLYACKYFMARRHWQIIRNLEEGKRQEGRVETLRVEEAPREVVRMAMQAANLIGDSLYGVDVKVSGGKCYIIEINDNPSIEAGYEDEVLKDDLYLRIMAVFLERIERKKQAAP